VRIRCANDRYVYERVRDFLARRHKVAGRGTQRFSCDVVYGERALLRFERLPPNGPAVCLTVKPVGETDALIGHVRFDERGWSVAEWPELPRPSSTTL
jgi:hypothetical protein